MRRGAALVVLLASCAEPASPPPTDTPRPGPEVIATVDGQAITEADVSGGVRMEIFRREVDVHSLLSREVERLVEARLLAKEAARRGLSVEALLAEEVDAKVSPPSAEAVEAAMVKEGAPASARPRVELYLRERARIERRLAFVAGLRASAEVKVRLEPPRPPRVEVDLTEAPVRGDAQAPVTAVAFLDWRSPLSARCARDLARLAAAHPGAVRQAHRTVLRAQDELGLEAAILAELAKDRGRFWEVHDALLLRDSAWTQAELHDVARRLEVEPSVLETMRDDPEWLMRLKQTSDRARAAGVTAPPVVFLNGRYFSCTFGYDALERTLQEELRHAPTAKK